MVNSNPETVSTDYDTSDKLYFEPLTLEDSAQHLRPGATGRRNRAVRWADAADLAAGLLAAGVPILGDATASIEKAEDRKLFAAMLDKLGLRQTPSGSAVSADEASRSRSVSAYPVLVRPSFVLGGRAMDSSTTTLICVATWRRRSR
jgi:carbamoyl-phosphate synthase large subunit